MYHHAQARQRIVDKSKCERAGTGKQSSEAPEAFYLERDYTTNRHESAG
jgi:hypothetical protein